MTNPARNDKILIRFDGMCVLCSRIVRIILKTDKNKKFVFQTLQKSGESTNPETIVVTFNGKDYQYFEAVLVIAKELGGVFRIIEIFRAIPENWRKSIYLWIARNRFRWFGKRTSCYIPTEEERDRFI